VHSMALSNLCLAISQPAFIGGLLTSLQARLSRAWTCDLWLVACWCHLPCWTLPELQSIRITWCQQRSRIVLTGQTNAHICHTASPPYPAAHLTCTTSHHPQHALVGPLACGKPRASTCAALGRRNGCCKSVALKHRCMFTGAHFGQNRTVVAHAVLWRCVWQRGFTCWLRSQPARVVARRWLHTCLRTATLPKLQQHTIH
jgi:hypothetical protein